MSARQPGLGLGLACLAALVALLLPATARANPADLFGLGSRGASLAGACAATTDDSSAIYYNPAGVAHSPDLQIDLGYQVGAPQLRINGRSTPVEAIHGLSGGLVVPGKLFGVRFAFGLAVFLPDDRLNRSRSLAYAQPRWVYYDNRAQRLYLAAGIGVNVWKGLYLGVSLAFMARTSGTVDIRGNISPSDPMNGSVLVDAVNVDLLAVRYPQAGLLWDINRFVSLALTYRHSFSLTLDQGFVIHGTVADPPGKPLISDGRFLARTVSADLFQPWQLTLGLAVRVLPRLRVSFDATFARWSEFTAPASTVDIKLDLGASFNALINVPPPRVYPSPGFHDLLIPRIGLEWRALERERLALDVRLGYRFEASPVPEQTGETSYADGDKHFVGVGVGLALRRLTRVLPKPLTIDAHVGVTAIVPSTNRKSDPTDRTGDFVTSGSVVEGGLTTRWAF